MNRLMLALSSQKIEVEIPKAATVLYYDDENLQATIEKACALREQGERVELVRKK